MPHTVVFFHAHPDDEALLTSGTMATLSAQGHRVVLVVATAGEAGLAADELTALADQHRIPPPGSAECAPGRVGDRTLEGDLGGLTRVAVGDGHLSAPGRVGLQVGAQAAQGPAGVVAGGDAQADLGPGARDEGVRRPGDRRGVEGDDGDIGGADCSFKPFIAPDAGSAPPAAAACREADAPPPPPPPPPNRGGGGDGSSLLFLLLGLLPIARWPSRRQTP